MKESLRVQKCLLTSSPVTRSETKLKCFTIVAFEKEGKTILQPLVNGPETEALQDMFQSDTLEVWMPNGKSDAAEFDVSILKYRMQMQPSTRCSRDRNRVCLKNYVATIVSCEQCPIKANGAKY